MIIGKKDRFAVEFELDQEFGGEWLFGRLGFWIENQQIGDYNLGTSLRDVLFQVKSIVRDNGNRSHEELFGLDKIELYKRIKGALYDCIINEYYQVALDETWARFNVNIPVDVFDGWNLFLVENENLEQARLIAVKLDNKEIYESILKKGEFDEIITSLYKELDKLYEIELAK
ncbi:MAG: hypothetical protein H6Q73_3366 [Firmicutes bacterium]|nr:hypothetical protein [Bacillota bacterium]